MRARPAPRSKEPRGGRRAPSRAGCTTRRRRSATLFRDTTTHVRVRAVRAGSCRCSWPRSLPSSCRSAAKRLLTPSHSARWLRTQRTTASAHDGVHHLACSLPNPRCRTLHASVAPPLCRLPSPAQCAAPALRRARGRSRGGAVDDAGRQPTVVCRDGDAPGRDQAAAVCHVRRRRRGWSRAVAGVPCPHQPRGGRSGPTPARRRDVRPACAPLMLK